jgi:hypothetical protein
MSEDFKIKNGIIQKYVGNGGTVYFPIESDRVSAGAFHSAKNDITEMVFPESMTEIPEAACYCLGTLRSAVIPKGVLRIGARSFCTCTELNKIEFPESLREIGFGAFRDCAQLETIRLPENISKLDGSAFEGCRALKIVSIPEGIQALGSRAFAGCKSLTEMTIPKSITKLPSGLFAGCSSLTSVSLPDGLTEIDVTSFGACKSLQSIQIPGSVTTIGDRAFSGCSALREIALPEGIETIGEDVFADCAKELKIYCSGKIFGMLSKETKDCLTKQWLSGLTEYGKDETAAIKKYAGRTRDRMFTELRGDDGEALARLLTCGKPKPESLAAYIEKCSDGAHPKMMAMLLDYQNKNVSPKKKEEIADKQLGLIETTSKDLAKVYRWTEEENGIVIVKYKSIDAEADIPSHIDGVPVIKIGKNAFKANTQIKTVRIPNTVIEIGESAFEKCSVLSRVEWSEELRVIEKRAFCGCEQIEGALILPKNIKSVGVNAFSGCPFSALEIPDGVETLANGAFDSCDINEFHIPASVKELGLCCGYYTGDFYIHGKNTKIKEKDFHGMPMTVHAPTGSYAAKLSEKGLFENFIVFEET